MADVTEALNKLIEVRGRLVAQLKQIDDLIKQLQGIQTRIDALEPGTIAPPPIANYFTGPENASNTALWRRGEARPAQIAEHVRQLLRQEKRPMTRSQIARRLIEAGVPLVGRDISKNIGTILWRHQNEFVHLAKLGYWLADVELPGVYAPPRK